MPGIDEVVIFKTDTEGRARRAIAEADMIFCLDFNAVSRLEILSDTIAANTTARRVLIDHHLSPDEGFDLMFSHPDSSSSTCFLVYSIVEAMCGAGAITRRMAESLYVGMMTDTGNFAFSFLTPELFRAVAVLVEKGISIPDHSQQRLQRLYRGPRAAVRLCHQPQDGGDPDGTVAYMSLLENEMRRFSSSRATARDSSTTPSRSKKVKMSAMFSPTASSSACRCVLAGRRRRQPLRPEVFQRRRPQERRGGKSFVSMQETIDHYVRSVRSSPTKGIWG